MPADSSAIDRNVIEQRLRTHVHHLAAKIGPRTLAEPETMQATVDYLQSEWQEMPLAVKQEPYEALGQPTKNLLVEVPGNGKPEEIVLLGAHYDTVAGSPGADDNGSAVAVLLEVCRLLRQHSGRRTARYVAFTCEEKPYGDHQAMGSQHHARLARERGDQITAMLCLEMVGYFRDEPGSQKVPPTIPKWLHPIFPKRGNFLAAVGNLKSCQLSWHFRRGYKQGLKRTQGKLPLFSIVLPEKIEEIRRSDNSSFWDQGYPALMLTDTSFLRSPHYHQPSDLPETLDYPRMVDVVLGVAGAMRRLLK